MEQPKGFEVKGKKVLVCKLNRFLYGLKQSPRCWYKHFDDYISLISFIRSLYDPCIYYKKLIAGYYIYLLLYFDDMLLVERDPIRLKESKAQLSVEFDMKDLEAAKKILGIEILRDRNNNELSLTQKTSPTTYYVNSTWLAQRQFLHLQHNTLKYQQEIHLKIRLTTKH